MKRISKVLAAVAVLSLAFLLIAKGPDKKDVSELVVLVGPLDASGNPARAGDIENYDNASAPVDISVGLRYRSAKLRLHESLLRASLVLDQATCEALTTGRTSNHQTDPEPVWDVAKGCYYPCDSDGDGWCDQPFYGQVRLRQYLGLLEFYFDTQPRDVDSGVCRWASADDIAFRDQYDHLPEEVCRYALDTRWGQAIYDGEDVAVEAPASTALFDNLAGPAGHSLRAGLNTARGTVFDFEPYRVPETPPVTAQYTITGDVSSTGAVDIGTNVWTYGTIDTGLWLSENVRGPLGLTPGPYFGKARLSVLTDDLLSDVLLRRFDFHFDTSSGCQAPTPDSLPPPSGVCQYSLTVLYGLADSTGVEFSPANSRNSRALVFDRAQEANNCNDPVVDDWTQAPLVLRGGPHCVAMIDGVNIRLDSGGVPEPPSVESVCKNGKDDDGDGLIDCADPDCYTSKFCQ